MRTFAAVAEIAAAAGESLGHSDWLTITQERVDRFAEATDDHQWIHVDAARAAQGPFAGTIAHGYLTLALIPALSEQLIDLSGSGAVLNYGLDKVRFPSPVRVGARVRLQSTIGSLTEVAAGHRLTVGHVIEIEGGDKPACVAETVVLLVAL